MSTRVRVVSIVIVIVVMLASGGLLVRLEAERAGSSDPDEVVSVSDGDTDWPSAETESGSMPTPLLGTKDLPDRGTPLGNLERMPVGTLSYLARGTVGASDSLRVEFVPYGYVPESGGTEIVTQIMTAEWIQFSGDDRPIDLERQIAVLRTDATVRQSLERVARYTGRIRFSEAGPYLTMLVEDVSFIAE